MDQGCRCLESLDVAYNVFLNVTLNVTLNMSLNMTLIPTMSDFGLGNQQIQLENVTHNMTRSVALNGRTQLLNCQWNSSDIDTCQMLKYQS